MEMADVFDRLDEPGGRRGVGRAVNDEERPRGSPDLHAARPLHNPQPFLDGSLWDMAALLVKDIESGDGCDGILDLVAAEEGDPELASALHAGGRESLAAQVPTEPPPGVRP